MSKEQVRSKSGLINLISNKACELVELSDGKIWKNEVRFGEYTAYTYMLAVLRGTDQDYEDDRIYRLYKMRLKRGVI